MRNVADDRATANKSQRVIDIRVRLGTQVRYDCGRELERLNQERIDKK